MTKEKKIKLSGEALVPGVKLPSAQDLLAAGAHFGHSTKRWHPAYKPFIYTKRKGIYIINVEKSVESFKQALSKLVEFVKEGKRILLVGTKKQAAPLVRAFGEEHGIFYIDKKWPGGLLTNFDQLKQSINRLVTYKERYIRHKYDLTKKELVVLKRRINKLEAKFSGVVFMEQLPDLVIIIDPNYEKVALKEARANGIPVLAMVDTNTDPRLIDYPVFMNDDAIKAIKLFLDVIAQVFKKYGDASLKAVRAEFEKHLQTLEQKVDSTVTATQARALTQEPQKEQEKEQKGQRRVIRVAGYTPLDKLDFLTKRHKMVLKNAGINSLEALQRKTYEELLAIRGISPKTAKYIISKLKEYGKK